MCTKGLVFLQMNLKIPRIPKIPKLETKSKQQIIATRLQPHNKKYPEEIKMKMYIQYINYKHCT